MIKWSAFHSRYHLPLFILFAPFLAVVLHSCFRSWGVIILAVILTAASFSWVVGNKSRPLLGARSVITAQRMDQYFFNSPANASYIYPLAVAAQVDCKQIGLVMGSDTWEYPLRAISQFQHRDNIRFEHILVDNASAKLQYPLGAFEPCLVIEKDSDSPAVLNWQGQSFTKIGQKDSIATYLRGN